uniref:PH domain-containing protein n=1 Tax=Timspurckia oligopyrenoides TaxID=708627 RepID=A0A7S1ERG8_9RHOD|mmetsp:Transcript_1885/g.3361  ORF Transcript_1885/g.3361 Transcript_1885/m.3361 type:complete len:241 (+) Transcript_1885:81-803(+)|eukprot:CAMPEP_0182449510 /NCGR_PEP_ID=MMETSP1172-20130603/35010_1 /TAXON_ID=708627 /ORGANISM="Timspurckia oligopyrenoides, Strain CCMP3278" /LENGTH=240 /DNA_ID=CAMNT_0024646823 /DNA_START=74 /DNA_END=796 /DNA_ORIENTATION=+
MRSALHRARESELDHILIENIKHNSVVLSLGTRMDSEGMNILLAEQMLAEFQKSMDAASDNSSDVADRENAPAQKNFGGTTRKGNDQEESNELFDIPSRLTQNPGAAAALRDLERCSIAIAANANAGKAEDPNTFARGDLYLRQRFFTTSWNKRYAVVVNHAYFGPVLFLFKYDKRGQIMDKQSRMIILVDSSVKMADDVRDNTGVYRCVFTLKTKKKYIIAAPDAIGREYWISVLRSYS